MNKQYFRYYSQEDRIRCHYEIAKGEIGKFMIQYEIFWEGKWRGVVRYDTFHNILHRDSISPDGTIDKKWLFHMNFDEGLDFAYNDLSENWEKYRALYLSKMVKT